MDAIEKWMQYLYSSDRDEFKSWSAYHGLSKKKGADFCFDDEKLIDNTKSDRPVIACVQADGTLRWGEVLSLLKSYFNIKPKAQ